MDMMVAAAFVAFLTLVVAWLVAPATVKPTAAPIVDPGTIVVAESPA